MICIGLDDMGLPCPKAGGKNGFCKVCDPAAKKSQKEKLRKAAQKAREKELKDEQKEELDKQELAAMISECQTVEDIRMLELKILQQVVSGKIDPRAGSFISQTMKHQVELIDRKNSTGTDVKEGERKMLEDRAKKMTAEDMLGLIGDFTQGYKVMVKEMRQEAQESADILMIEAQEVNDG